MRLWKYQRGRYTDKPVCIDRGKIFYFLHVIRSYFHLNLKN